MVSRHTGSNKLLEIQSDTLVFVIKSKNVVRETSEEWEKSSIVVKGSDIREIIINNRPVYEDGQDGFAVQNFSVGPLFFEQTDYEVVVQSKNGQEVSFWHENSNIREKVNSVIDDGTLISGIINFRNTVGYSEIIMITDKNKILSVRIEVYSTKISYKEDYLKMLHDISDEVYTVAVDFLRQTYQNYRVGNNRDTVPAVFFQIISKIFEQFVQATNRIITFPHHKLKEEHLLQPFYKIKKTDSRTRHWVERHPEYVKMSSDRVISEKALGVTKQITYNTLENQFAKYILINTTSRLIDFKKRYLTSSKDQEQHVLNSIDVMTRTLNRLLNGSFLKNVDTYRATQSMSLVFGMARGYRELYKYYLILQKGLGFHGDVFRISMKDTAQLYEYWCFIKLANILKKRFELSSPDIVKADNTGITVTLVKGKKSEVRFFNPRTGEHMVLSYNPGEQQTQTINQKPDNVLTLEKRGSDVPYKYVFDAKYKIETNLPNDFYPDTKPGPKVEDINTMHRYRDAILYEDKSLPKRFRFEKTMFGAYVLFPYDKEDEYKEHRFYKSIESVNIGGLPFLPGHTQLVELLLNELINDSDESAFERAILPRGIETKIEKVDWEVRDVLVGSLGSNIQLQKNIEYNFYYAPAKYISDKQLPIRYVAIYQSKSKGDPGIKYYGEVTSISKIRRNEIKEVPVRKDNPDERYYYFKVKKWDILQKPITIKTERVYEPKFTNLFLLKNSTDTYELFNIISESEYRLLQELKRTYQDTCVREKMDGIVFRANENATIYTMGGNFILCDETGKIIKEFNIEQFASNPRREFNKIKEYMGKIIRCSNQSI